MQWQRIYLVSKMTITPETQREAAKELAAELHNHIYGDDDGGHIENQGIELIAQALAATAERARREALKDAAFIVQSGSKKDDYETRLEIWEKIHALANEVGEKP